MWPLLAVPFWPCDHHWWCHSHWSCDHHWWCHSHWSCDHHWWCCSGHVTTTGSAVLVMWPPLAVPFWPCDHHWQCRSGHMTTTGSAILVMWPPLVVSFWPYDHHWQCFCTCINLFWCHSFQICLSKHLILGLLTTDDKCTHHATFGCMLSLDAVCFEDSLGAICFEDSFCTSKKGWIACSGQA